MNDIMLEQTVYWKDPEGKDSGYYRVVEMDKAYDARGAAKEIKNPGKEAIVVQNRAGSRNVCIEDLESVNYEQREPEYRIQNKDFYLRFAELFNTRVFQRAYKSEGWLHQIYERLTSFRWDFAPHYSEFYTDFFTELHNAVNEVGLRLRSPLPIPELQTRPLAIYPRVAPKLPVKGVLSLKPLIPTDMDSPYAYHGIGILNEWAYATDGKCLAKIKDDRWTPFSGKITSYSSFELNLINENFNVKPIFLLDTIDYEAVIPLRTEQTLVWTWNSRELNNLMYSVRRNIKDFPCSVGLQFSEQAPIIYLDPKGLSNLLRILCANGAQRVDLEYRSPTLPMLLRADNENIGLIAPLYNSKWIITTFKKE